jgi:hypothetical protein
VLVGGDEAVGVAGQARQAWAQEQREGHDPARLELAAARAQQQPLALDRRVGAADELDSRVGEERCHGVAGACAEDAQRRRLVEMSDTCTSSIPIPRTSAAVIRASS